MTTQTQTQSTWRNMLQPDQLLPGATAGLVMSVIVITVSIAFGALVYAGNVTDDNLYRGIGLAIFGSMAVAGLTALTSSFPSVITNAQDGPAAVLALISAALAEEFSGSLNDDELFFTITVIVMTTTLITGVMFWLLGRFELGNLIRFVPYPVVGGFLAGSGLLLLQGSISIMADAPVSYEDLPAFHKPALLEKWLPGLLFAVTLYILLRRFSHFLILPGAIVGGIVVFYVVLLLTGTSVDTAAEQGWLLQTLEGDSSNLWKPLSPNELEAVDWAELLHHIPAMAAVSLVSIIAMLLNVSGMELSTSMKIDVNRELKSAGAANLVAGVGGGIPGYQALSLSVLAHKISGGSRLPGFVMAATLGGVLLVGAALLAYFPKVVLGGLLLMLALDFLYTWLYEAWAELPWGEYSIVIVITVIINTVGFLEGVAAGLIFALLLFAVNYSRVNLITNHLDGTTYQSNVMRSPMKADLLREHGQAMTILRLKGYIFFGTAHRLLVDVEELVDNQEQRPLSYIVLDFRQVRGVDSSAVRSFGRMVQVVQHHDIQLIFADMPPDIKSRLEANVLSSPNCHLFPDLDHGVEWIEDQILARHPLPATSKSSRSMMHLFESTVPPGLTQRLAAYLEEQTFAAGQTIIRQGEASPGMLFVEDGQVTVQLEHEDGSTTRIRTMGVGTLIGEMGTYLGQPASASVVADESCVVYRMTAAAMKTMEADDPKLATAFHRFMARFLARRLTQTTETLSAFVD